MEYHFAVTIVDCSVDLGCVLIMSRLLMDWAPTADQHERRNKGSSRSIDSDDPVRLLPAWTNQTHCRPFRAAFVPETARLTGRDSNVGAQRTLTRSGTSDPGILRTGKLVIIRMLALALPLPYGHLRLTDWLSQRKISGWFMEIAWIIPTTDVDSCIHVSSQCL